MKPFQSILVLLLLSLKISCHSSQIREFNVVNFGAVPDGKTLSTQAIQKAIDKAVETKGTVVFPKGTFYSGSLILGPDITIVLEEGATLLASNDMADYRQKEFILAPFADNLVVRGKGTIDGNGLSFFDDDWNFKERPEPWINIQDAKNVRVEGITLKNSPSHTLNFSYCKGVEAKDITIKNHPRSRNTDGIDIRNSVNVLISGCDIRTGDDAICIKNGRSMKKLINPNGGQRFKVTEKVSVRDCYLESDDAALKLGTSSGFLIRDISFDSIVIRNTRYAIALFNMDGGTYEDIKFSDIDAITGGDRNQEYGVFMDVHQREENGPLGTFRNITIENSTITTNGINYISGHPQKEAGPVILKNVIFSFPDNMNNSTWKKPKGNRKVKHWPSTSDYVRYDAAFILAHLEDLKMKDVQIYKGTVRSDSTLIKSIEADIDTTNLKITMR